MKIAKMNIYLKWLLLAWFFPKAHSSRGVTVPSSFQVNIQINSINDKETMRIREFYDGRNGQRSGSVILWRLQGKKQMLYEFSATNHSQILEEDKFCYVQSKSEHGGMFEINNKVPLFSLVSFFDMAEDLDRVADSMTDNYVTEYKSKDVNIITKDNTILNYSVIFKVVENFTNWELPNFNPTTSNGSFPYAAEISGFVNKNPFKTTYRFYNYEENVNRSEEFQIPPGVFCNLNDHTSKNLTSLPQGFTTGIEIVFSSNKKDPTMLKLFYDKDLQMIRHDYYLDKGDSDSVELPSVQTEISDYESNLFYTINKSSGECSVEKLNKFNQTLLIPKVLEALLDEETQKNEFFLYIGKRLLQGTLCDVWVLTEYKRNYEIYMKEVLNEAKIVYIPILINETQYIDFGTNSEPIISYTQWYFLNFEIKRPRIEFFDVADCYEDKYKKPFQMTLSSFNLMYSNDVNDLARTIREETAKILNVTAKRFEKTKIDYSIKNESILLFTAIILEDPFNIDKFELKPNNANHPTNQQVYNDLFKIINDMKFKIGFKPINSGLIFYMGLSIRDDVLPSYDFDEMERLKIAYDLHTDVLITSDYSDYQKEPLSVFECAKACTLHRAFQCESFSHCRTSFGDCRLSSRHLMEVVKTVNITSCDTYTRKYLNDYNVIYNERMAPGKHEVARDFSNIEDCARMCSLSNDSFLTDFCEGFNACQHSRNSFRCEFRYHHAMEDPKQLQNAPSCDHYTRDYSADFFHYVNQTTTDVIQIVNSDTSSENCARLCRASITPCLVFTMCQKSDDPKGDKTVCSFVNYGDLSIKLPMKKSTSCDLFKRVHDLPLKHPDPYHNNTTPEPPKNDTTVTKIEKHFNYSSGVTAAVALCMILLGLFIGIALIFAAVKLHFILIY